MLVLKNRGWVGWRLEKILKMSEGSYVSFSYSKNYVQYLEKKQENMERKCNRGSREMECVDISNKLPAFLVLMNRTHWGRKGGGGQSAWGSNRSVRML